MSAAVHEVAHNALNASDAAQQATSQSRDGALAPFEVITSIVSPDWS